MPVGFSDAGVSACGGSVQENNQAWGQSGKGTQHARAWAAARKKRVQADTRLDMPGTSRLTENIRLKQTSFGTHHRRRAHTLRRGHRVAAAARRMRELVGHEGLFGGASNKPSWTNVKYAPNSMLISIAKLSISRLPNVRNPHWFFPHFPTDP